MPAKSRNKKNKRFHKQLSVFVLIVRMGLIFISSPTLRSRTKQLLRHHNIHQLNFRQSKADLSKYTVFGIDVSQYQKTIVWRKVINQEEIAFAFVRATAGSDLRDDYFTHNWRSCQKYNIIKGAYHYYRPNENSLLQAENFIKNVELKAGDLPPVLDIEDYSDIQSLNSLKVGLLKWLQKVENHYGVRPIIYTYHKYYQSHFIDDNRFSKYNFWLARYGSKNNYNYPNSKWLFWQYSKKGNVLGIEGDVDLNVFNGDIQKLESICIK